ncbi:hypothetical protein NQ315_010842 [Exocentrus adspersus]|uniref:Reverse transcriptase n=1 Tax=Exocentrus adspersus TaxID=1586481 RepID=A0AAV8V415_9CUCU|nr:hypothetical protein NQ315_010842 [Exocentrus adspersus]
MTVKIPNLMGFNSTLTGCTPTQIQVASMLNYPVPKNVREVRWFIGMVSWYRRFIPNFATRIAPITVRFIDSSISDTPFKDEDDWKVVVPKSLRKAVCSECHDEPVTL